MVHHMTEMNGVRLHYAEAGQGDPVLLLPAHRRTGALAQDGADAGRAASSVIVLDPRGYGVSDKPASGYDLDTAAADIHCFIVTAGVLAAGW